jgi:hypothetical protein
MRTRAGSKADLQHSKRTTQTKCSGRQLEDTDTVQTGYITVTHVQSVGICVQFIMYCSHNFTLREVRSASHATLIKDLHSNCWSRDSVVGIATRYGLEGPGIEARWGEIFRTYPDRLRGPPSLLHNGYRVFSGGKGGRGVMLTTHPLLVPRLRKS